MMLAISSNAGDWLAAGMLAVAMVVGVLRGATGR